MRLVLRAAAVTVLTAVGVVACLYARIVSPGGRLGLAATAWWSRALLRVLGIPVVREQADDVGPGPYVVVSNHTSMLDICIAAAAVPVPFFFTSRPAYFRVPLLGWGMHLARHVPLDPTRPRQAAAALARLGERFERGFSVLLFPEGTRSFDGTLLRYRRGPFLTAIRHGIPVLPVYMEGVHERLRRGTLRLSPGEVRLTIGSPLPTAGLEESASRDLAQRVETWSREQQARHRPDTAEPDTADSAAAEPGPAEPATPEPAAPEPPTPEPAAPERAATEPAAARTPLPRAGRAG